MEMLLFRYASVSVVFVRQSAVVLHASVAMLPLYFFFPFVLSKISTQCLFTPLFSNAFTTASFCGP